MIPLDHVAYRCMGALKLRRVAREVGERADERARHRVDRRPAALAFGELQPFVVLHAVADRREAYGREHAVLPRVEEYAVAPRVEPAGHEGVGVVEGLLLLAVPVVDMPEQEAVGAEEMRLEAEDEPPLDWRMVVAGEIRVWPDRAACRVPVDEPALRAQVVRDVVVPSRGQRAVYVGHDQVVQLRAPSEELAPAGLDVVVEERSGQQREGGEVRLEPGAQLVEAGVVFLAALVVSCRRVLSRPVKSE